MQFSLTSIASGPDLRLVMTGDLDVFGAGQVRRAVRDGLGAGCSHARLDASGVTFVDASALGVLVRARGLAAAEHGTLEVVRFNPVFERLCALTRLLGLLAPEGHEPLPEPAPAA